MIEKILVDTDIGSDLDDALCLAYLLAQPECVLVGITTVTGEPDVRAQLASILCTHAGEKVPIVPGAADPLQVAQQQLGAPQAAALKRWAHETDFAATGAPEFIRDVIRSNPGEVTLLAIGPLTNIALAFELDPQLPALLRGMMGMFGVFTTRSDLPKVEWNSLLDPHAARAVYSAHVPHHRTVGLDVTHQVRVSAKRFEELLDSSSGLEPLKDFARPFFDQYDWVFMHDPLAAASIFQPGLCTFQSGLITVHTTSDGGGVDPGATTWEPVPTDGPHQIATAVDIDSFFKHYKATLTRAPDRAKVLDSGGQPRVRGAGGPTTV